MEFVAIAQINKEGAKKVADLTDRPNITGGYGKPKLTPQDLKQWFDKFPDLICEKVNQILEAFKTTSTTEGEGDNQQTIAGNGNYIALNLGDNKSDNEQVKLGNSLAGLVNSLFNGAFAARLLVDLGESGKSDNLQSLLSILNNLTTNISTNAENISNLEEGKFAKYQNPDTGEYEDKIVTNQIAAGAVTSEKIDSELLKNMVFEDELEGFIDGIDYNEKEYKLTFTRKGVENPIVVDLPVETLVLSVEYVSSSKSLRIKLTNGNVIDVSLNDIITGLVNSSDILHTTGTSDNKVMSQKAVTDALKNVDGKHINLVQVEKVIDYNTGTIIPTLKLERENGGYVGIALDDLIPSKIKKSFSDVAYDATTGVLTFTSIDG